MNEKMTEICIKIIKAQEPIIGSVAWDEAKRVVGLIIDQSHKSVSFSGDPKDIINRLVVQYTKLFGKASYEICKEAVQDLISQLPPEEIPSIFKKDLKFSENKKISEKLYEQSLQVTEKLTKTQKSLQQERVTHKEFVGKTGEVMEEIERIIGKK